MSTYQSKFTGAEIDERLEEAEKISPHIEDKANPHETTAEQAGAVPIIRKVNNKALADDITLTPADVSAVATADIVNSLTETGTGKVLDARQGRTLSDFIGDQTYTEKNYIADGESATSSINKLDMQLKDTADLVSTNILKIAQVDKEVADHQKIISSININNEATQTATGYGIVTLPKNAANGHMGVKVNGVTTDGVSTQTPLRVRSVSADETHESSLYLPDVGVLRSVPNGTKDEINLTTGVKTQRNKENILQASNISFLTTTGTNVDIVGVKRPTDHIAYGASSAAVGDTVLGNYTQVNTADEDNATYINCFTLRGTSQFIMLFVAKGTYANLAAAQAALAGLTLTYQLATPIVTPVQVSGNLVSHPSGTVYIEPVVADAGIYTDKMTVLQQDLPIHSIEKISKVDYATGVETELDTSTAVIAVGGLSFTHPDLVVGDIVFFTYFYDSALTTLGETNLTYYDSRYTIADTADGKFYQWAITSTNGVPSISLVEV